jgi:hypothetical protein
MQTKQTTKTIFGIYDSQRQAEQVQQQLVDAGFARDSIDIIIDDEAREARANTEANFHDDLPERTGSYGDIDFGADAASPDPLLTSLKEAGIAEYDARTCVRRVRQGALLVLVRATEENARQAAEIVNPASEETSRTVQSYVSDMLSIEQHILDSINQQATDSRVQEQLEVDRLVRRLRETGEDHIATLQRHLSGFDSQVAGPVKQVMGTVSGALSGLYTSMRSDPVSRMMRDNYTALSTAAMSYTMLHTMALAQQEYALADMALKHLRDVTPLLVDISRVLPVAVVSELAAEGKIGDTSVAHQAVENTQSAWSSDVVS